MPSPLRYIHKLSRRFQYNFSRGGLIRLWSKVVYRIKLFIYSERKWIIFYLDLEGYSLTPEVHLVHEIVGFEELQRIHYFKALSFPETIQDRYHTGAECHVFYKDGVFVNLSWIAFDNLPLIPKLSILHPGCIGVFDVITLREHRRRGFNLASQIMIALHAKDRGVRFLISAVEPYNTGSIKSMERAGYQKAYLLSYQSRFGFKTVIKSEYSDEYLKKMAK